MKDIDRVIRAEQGQEVSCVTGLGPLGTESECVTKLTASGTFLSIHYTNP